MVDGVVGAVVVAVVEGCGEGEGEIVVYWEWE